MKKSLLFMLPCALALASCSGSKLDKGSIFNETFMKKNFTPEYSLSTVKNDILNVSNISFDFDSVIADPQASWLMHVVKDGKVGLFSASNNSMLVGLAEGQTINVQPVNASMATAYFVEVKTTNTETLKNYVKVIDELGNVLYDGEGQGALISGSMISKDQRKDKEVVRFKVSPYGASTPIDAVFAYYGVDGALLKRGSAKDYTPGAGEVFIEESNLKAYGHPELSLIRSAVQASVFDYELDNYVYKVVGTRYTVHNNEKHEYVTSFVIPTNVVKIQVGTHVVCQEKNLLEERATDYDLFLNGNKYDIETYRINLLDGKKDYIDSRFYFADTNLVNTKSLYNEKGIYEYYYMSDLRMIKDNKALEPEYYGYIFNEKLEVLADVTGINFANLKQYGDRYLDRANGIVYDAHLHEVGAVQANSTNIMNDPKYGTQGLVGLDGKILLPATASSITELDSNKGIYYVRGSTSSLVQVDNENNSIKTLADLTNYNNLGSQLSNGTRMLSDEDGNKYVLDIYTGQIIDDFKPAETDTVVLEIDSTISYGLTSVFNRIYRRSDGSHYSVKTTTEYAYVINETETK